MSDKFYRVPARRLLSIILNEEKKRNSIFGIPKALFYNKNKSDILQIARFGKNLQNPIGVAAGPHTQLAQNIISAWLTGARFIELKTVQVLDELEISKPCIDMQDEGYNCEWSQELKIQDSFDEYLTAWVIIHVLNHHFGWKDDIGTIFNMSVGYNLEGIKSEKVQWFFNKMKFCKEELVYKINELKQVYPDIEKLKIPPTISDNITLSTMHGCPPHEILEIGKYLLHEKELHTAIKLNPTLLGPEKLREILNNNLGFKTIVPDIAFKHDLKYEDALKIIQELTKLASKKELFFGLKLTNTLESTNHKEVFAKSNEMMYMSGRALHPIAINLAKKLQQEFNGKLNISFSAGADCFNISDIISCNLMPATVCTDILKPGGYGRLNQYIEELYENIKQSGASINVQHYAQNPHKSLSNLHKYAKKVLSDDYYVKKGFIEPSIKTERKLNYFDCINAPCIDTCPTNQNIPEYLFHASKGEFEKAFEVILRTNPFPSVTGMVCDHLCQTKCTRINYDSSLLIREVKRFIAENRSENYQFNVPVKNGLKVGIIGAGPSGLSCAHFSTLSGFEVNVYETQKKSGGMVSGAIPSFRLTDEAIKKDVQRIENLGVKIHFNQEITKEKFNKLKQENDFIYIATGAQKSSRLKIPGINMDGILDSLEFLFNAKANKQTGIGKNVAIIGGGNTAMDAARTAYRLVGDDGKVTVVYRRTKAQMPADLGEIKAVIEEGVEIMELVAPEYIEDKNDKLVLYCSRMKLGEKDSSGRRRPEIILNSEFSLDFDTIIPAIGQDLAIDFISHELLKTKIGSYQTKDEKIFIGGDAMRGASTAINAIGDGRKAAEEITKIATLNHKITIHKNFEKLDYRSHLLKRSTRIKSTSIKEVPLNERKSFKLVASTLTEKEIIAEASRCLYCDEVCNICVTVCPNRSNYAYHINPVNLKLKKAILNNGQLVLIEDEYFNINQKIQIINIADWCNECGNCTTFCPTKDEPYKNKPKFYLTRESFHKEDEGFFIENIDNTPSIMHKSGKLISKLTRNNDSYSFENDDVAASFAKNDLDLIHVQFKNEKLLEYKFQKAAEMSILLDGAMDLYQ
ncbi:putative selenate reductase subunit YgfK [Bacteroidota bacterium]